MLLAERYAHPHKLWGLCCDYIFSTPEEAIQAAKQIQEEYYQPAGAWEVGEKEVGENYYKNEERIWIVASGASYWQAVRYLGYEMEEVY